jgi:arylsulfatase A-like enzyme
MDEQIGRLRKFLKEKGISENTIVFFCSDNGPADPLARKGIASAGPFRGHKHQLWEGGLRVPSVVEWPGKVKGGQTSGFLSGTVDYLPTILDILGLEPITDRPIDGVSLKPVLFGQEMIRPVPIASGYQRLYQNTEIYALIYDRYKICIPEKGMPMMLFDLQKDQDESDDISNEMPVLFNKMKSELDDIKSSWQYSREGYDYRW